ncbi:hypothetical protein C7M61_004046 [Candidozyma pseudohaemuli]|uniref:Uncharacterized protein n=1 Tax=Candidozyma pseudohaemuli TaxID=418784 RepID=A0A2P7YJT5_9ASCO|nr:hypothetical protein C7M61_004046 [[Candida] pseudohaemulonii]PSK36227.1 hypothetical protein C7M61_004046 [[Candida] pseudohaemulonii]
MAQGNLKLKSKAKARVTKKQQNPRSSAPKIIKPKKASAKQAFKLLKSLSGLAGTEKLIASRVGHLELIKGSRRESNIAEQEEPQDLGNVECRGSVNIAGVKSEDRDSQYKQTTEVFAQDLRALDPDAVADEAKRLRKSKRRHE